MSAHRNIAAVVIGRNEGARLVSCLDALVEQVDQIVYVDSGSVDGSQEAARVRGAHVIGLDMNQPFTAARARNAGLAYLTEGDIDAAPMFIQFLDGDCILQPGWIDTAHSFLEKTPKAAVACGRRRERFPENSIYNSMIDDEWNTPIGLAKACGGDALFRTEALLAVQGYNPALIAGEEPELCVRLRADAWEIWRLDAEMTLHDADLTRFNQWWQRARRGGYACAEGVVMHGAPPERHNVREFAHIVIWSFLLPAIILLGLLVTPWALALVLAWPLQILRRLRRGDAWRDATFITLAKFPEAQGVLTYLWRRQTRADAQLIEYK